METRVILGLLDIALLLLAFGFSIFGMYVMGLSQFRLFKSARNIEYEKVGFQRYLFLISPAAIIFFPTKLDETGRHDRVRFFRGLRFMFIGGMCLLVSYWIGVGWQ